jgi:hypothetical protein
MSGDQSQIFIDAFNRLSPEQQREAIRVIEQIAAGSATKSDEAKLVAVVASAESYSTAISADKHFWIGVGKTFDDLWKGAGAILRQFEIKIRTDPEGFYLHLVRDNGWRSHEVGILWKDLRELFASFGKPPPPLPRRR